MSSGAFVDFKVVKAAVSMEQALQHYNIDWLRKKGDELRGRCPIHKGEGTDTFHANTVKGAFQCFSCKARGNVLDFVAKMENCTVRDAALKLAEWFSVPQSAASGGEGSKQTSPPQAPAEKKSPATDLVNKPLTFELKGVDPNHLYLAGRGISKENAEAFGLGYFSGKGSMAGRVVIPIHDEHGQLVAYAGRAIDNSEPKYKLPVGFHKSLVLYNLHRVADESSKRRVVVVVEGFFDCMKVTAAGFPCVALMGSSLSEAQGELLASHFKACWLMLDGDEAGRAAMVDIAGRLSRLMWVRCAALPDGKQPDSMNAEEIKALLDK